MADPTPPSSTPRSALPGRIRSLPTSPRRASASLPGMEALGYEGDMNWRRGITVLWSLVGLIAASEVCTVLFNQLGGNERSPTIIDLLRLLILFGVFLTLWLGTDWTRWVLAAIAFFYGGRSLVQVISAYNNPEAAVQFFGIVLPRNSVILAPLLASGIFYLMLSAYLAFSSDVTGFTKHRREEGQPWVIFPVACLFGCFLVAMCLSPFLFRLWLTAQRSDAEQFSRQALRIMSEHWDPKAFESLSSPELLQGWDASYRNNTLAMLAPLGPFQSSSEDSLRVNPVLDTAKDSFALQGVYHARGRFTHGRAVVDFAVTRPLFGEWRLLFFSPGFVTPDKPAPSAPTPAASPIPPSGG